MPVPGEPFEVTGNRSLLEVGPFGSTLSAVGGAHGRLFGPILEDNEQLSTIGTLQDWSVFETLELRQPPKLTPFIPDLFLPVPFSELDALDELVVEGCDSLVGLDGLGPLISGSQVVIRDNDALEGLSGLEQFARARLVIHGNAELRSLAAIDLAKDGTLDGIRFEVTDTPDPASCEAESVAVNFNPQ